MRVSNSSSTVPDPPKPKKDGGVPAAPLYKCRACGMFFPRDEIQKSGRRGGTQRYRCCTCSRISFRKWYSTPQGRIANRTKKHKWEERHPDHARAHLIVRRAVKSGKLQKPESCSVSDCKSPDVEGHHYDYSKPLSVIWVCPRHHGVLFHRTV